MGYILSIFVCLGTSLPGSLQVLCTSTPSGAYIQPPSRGRREADRLRSIMATARRGGAGGEPSASLGTANSGLTRSCAWGTVREGAGSDLARSCQGIQPPTGVTPQQSEGYHPQSRARLASPL